VRVARGAIAAGVRVRFSYRGRQDREPAVRTVEPWAVELSEGTWYLHGFDLGAADGRVFRLDRASGLEVTDERSTTAAPEDLRSPVYEPGPDDLEVELRLAPTAHWLIDAVRPDHVEEEADGTLRVTLRTGSPEWLARLVLMAGGGAGVVRPDALRERVRSRAQEALDRLS
jgi:proteasome accessory factor C